MRVALVLEHLDERRGGLEQYALGLARWLASRGHEVHAVAGDFSPLAEREPIVRHPVAAATSPCDFAAGAERLLRGLAADVVHDLGAGWSFDVLHPHFGSRIAGRRAALAAAAPAERLRALLSPRRTARYRALRALERRQHTARRGCIIAVSRLVRDDLERLHGVDPSRVRLIPNPVDVRRFRPGGGAGDREGVRARLGLRGEALFLCSAHNFPLKGVPTALRAARRLAEAGRAFRLAVLGGGNPAPLRPLLGGIEGRVSFCGRVADPAPYYAAADAFVHPSFGDACSLVVLEAAASGLPVIASRRDGASELLPDGEAALVLDDPADDRALAAAMERLLDEPLRLRLGAAARRSALACDSEAHYRRIEALYVEQRREARRS